MVSFTMADIPDALYREWKETVPRKYTLEEGMILLMAEATLEERDSLDEEDEQEIREAMEAITDAE